MRSESKRNCTMQHAKRQLIGRCVVQLALCFSVVAHAEIIDRVLAVVSGVVITQSDVTAAFDLGLAGKSWMDYLAERGFDVYALDLPGYGRSTRPAIMEQPAEHHPPFMRTADAVKALELSWISWSSGVALSG